MASVLRAGRSTGAALAVRPAGHALLIHPKGEPDPQAVAFATGLAQDDQHLLVVVDLPFGALDEAWPAVARLLAPRRGSLRLIFGRATPQEAHRAGQGIADRLQRLVLAPDGELLPTAGGGLFIPADHGAGWLRMRPGREPERDSQRFPKPLWEFSTLDRPWQTSEFGVAESVPSGVWVRSARPRGLLAAWRRLVDLLPSDRTVLTIVLGCPGGPAVPLADVVGVWQSVLPSVRSRVKFVQFGPVAVPNGGALGQALADAFAQPVVLWTDLPLGAGPLDAALPNWEPFVQGLQYTPGSAGPPVLLGLRPPLPGARQIGPTFYEYTASAVLEVVQAGLWMRPAIEPANSEEVRRIPAAPGYSALLYDRGGADGGERMKALAEDMLWRLEPAARPLFRIAPADDAALAAPPGQLDAWSLPEPSTEPLLTGPGTARRRPAHVALWATEEEASPAVVEAAEAVEQTRRAGSGLSAGQQGRALGSLAPDESLPPATAAAEAVPQAPALASLPPLGAPALPWAQTQTAAPANALIPAVPVAPTSAPVTAPAPLPAAPTSADSGSPELTATASAAASPVTVAQPVAGVGAPWEGAAIPGADVSVPAAAPLAPLPANGPSAEPAASPAPTASPAATGAETRADVSPPPVGEPAPTGLPEPAGAAARPTGVRPAPLPTIAPVGAPVGAGAAPGVPVKAPDLPSTPAPVVETLPEAREQAPEAAVRPALPAIAGIRLESAAPGRPAGDVDTAASPRSEEPAEAAPTATPAPASAPEPQSVRVQPVPKESALALPPQQGIEQEREWVRRTFSAQYNAIAGSVSRVMSESPGLRDGSRTAAEALTDLVAVRLYLSGEGAEVDDAVRGATVGPHVPLARCIASGLRRLPSYRGAALVRARLSEAERDWYHEGRTVTEWAFWTARTGWRPPPERTADLLVWSLTGRRTSLLDPAAPDRVVFLPGTAFKVLRNDDSGPRPLLLLRELTAAEAAEGGSTGAEPAPLDELALGVLDRAAEALNSATGGGDTHDPQGPVLGTAPGLLGRARPAASARPGTARRGASA